MNQETLYYSHIPGAILTSFGSVLIIFLYFKVKSLQFYALKLVVWISLYDLLNSVIILIPPQAQSFDEKCNILGFFLYFTVISSLIWNLVISVSLYQIMIWQVESPEVFYKFWLVFTFMFSSLVSIIPIFTSSYSSISGLCVLNYKNPGIWLHLVLIYSIETIVCVLLFYFYVRVYLKLKENSLLEVEDEEKHYEKILVFPLITALCLVPVIVQKTLVPFGIESFFFDVFAQAMFSLKGFFNTINYALTGPVLVYLRTCGKQEEEGIEASL